MKSTISEIKDMSEKLYTLIPQRKTEDEGQLTKSEYIFCIEKSNLLQRKKHSGVKNCSWKCLVGEDLQIRIIIVH